MSSCNKENSSNQQKRVREEDDEIVVTKVVQGVAPKKRRSSLKRLNQVYIVFKCQYPLHNDKWGEHSGHETEDTEVIGVFANLKEANIAARYETYEFDDDEDDDDDDDDVVSSTTPFYWQDDHPCEWHARRVWVEEQKIQY